MKKNRGSGDKGDTGVLGPERLSKSHARIEACGAVDELNCVLGALAAHLPTDRPELIDKIQEIQSDLMHVGALLASTSDSKVAASAKKTISKRTKAVTEATDRIDEDLPALKRFILPGGHASAAWAHMARSVCRRAERRVVSLLGGGGKGTQGLQVALVYLNRLSDYLFSFARHCNQVSGVEDIQWRKRRPEST
jgi:cob(I)alamin adenosyltransferase